jgi:hypothetical protein
MKGVFNDGSDSYEWKQNCLAWANSGILREPCQIKHCGDDYNELFLIFIIGQLSTDHKAGQPGF